MQDKIVITDASCFITLDKIDGMHLLHSLYKIVKIQQTNFRISDWLTTQIIKDDRVNGLANRIDTF